MDKYPIGFVLLVLFLGLFIGTVMGSLLQQVFGFTWLNVSLVKEGYAIVEDFYFLQRLEIQITPGSIIGFLVAAWYLYRFARKM